MSDPVVMHAGNARKAGRKWGIEPAVILGLLAVEGGTSPTGRPVAPADGAGPPSYGQFTYGTGAALGVRYGDSASETDAIGRYLTELGYQTDPRRALARYNGGSNPPAVSWTYADRVIAAARRYAGADGITADAPPAQPAAPASSSAGGGLFGAQERSGAVRALTTVALAAAGAVLVAVGVARSAGLRGIPGAPGR